MSAPDDREQSAWSRPDSADFVLVPPPASAGSQPVAAGAGSPGSTPISRPGHPEHPDAPAGLITERHDVPAVGAPSAGGSLRRDPVALGDFSHVGDRPPRAPRLSWFLGGAAVLAVIGLVVVLAMEVTGSLGSGPRLPFASSNNSDNGPPLAQACPPPTATSNPGYREGPPAPAGPRTVDSKAGISYTKYSSPPWQPWIQDWVAGQLKVHWRVGQGFITEEYSQGSYWASVVSAAVPATVNDGNILDLKCVGQQIVADVRGTGENNPGFYPQPNTMDKIEDKLTTIGGLSAYVSIFRMHFDDTADGLRAKSELVGVATFDVGKPTAAVLYVSIPETVRKYDWVVRDAITSVRAAN